MTKKSATKYLKDYTPYPWQILSADLDVKLDEASTQVKTVIRLKKKSTAESIYLNGKKLELHSLHLNGVPLTPAQYITDEDGLTIPCTAEDVVLETVCIIHPDKNTELQGLYVSDGILTTQCESEGFRSITYFPDRPDCTTVFSCRLTGDKDKYPVMLSNGNPVEASVNGNEHSVLWKDPFAKPSYLFALVAGKLVYTEDFYRTASGRNVALRIYSVEQHRNRHGFAIESLKKSMRWDEEVFGLEYDLDIYMIVAVDDFNFGAMENKGLNVFNSRFILADDELTTDAEKIRIEAIIAHEYFHNWTGNRVTLRNWFHLTLKEGLTVFRDQEFTQDVRLGSVKRIEDVQKLVTYQFPEDAGPLAHPPIPQSYVNMNNFYTVTVYEKGAEIVRMLQTILGRELFVTAVKDYIARHDGDCAAVEDFIAAMERASGKNLAQFLRWYYRPGTPHLNIITNYNTAVRTLTLTVVQTNPTSEKQGNSDPFMIPLHIGLIGKISRREITYQSAQQEQEGIFILTDKKTELTLTGLSEPPIISLNRGFSAPVYINTHQSAEEMRILAEYDTDEFNRQQAVKNIMREEIRKAEASRTYEPAASLSEIMAGVLKRQNPNDYYNAYYIGFPSYSELFAERTSADPDILREAYKKIFERCWRPLEGKLVLLIEQLKSEESKLREEQKDVFAIRELKNTLLAVLTKLNPGKPDAAINAYEQSQHITDLLAAFRLIMLYDNPARQDVKQDFYRRYSHYNPMFYNWISAAALSDHAGVFDEIEAVFKLPEFRMTNPNCISSAVAGLTANIARFHDKSGTGYRFLRDLALRTDKINPMLSAVVITKKFNVLSSLEPNRRALCQEYLRDIVATDGISPGMREVAEMLLKN